MNYIDIIISIPLLWGFYRGFVNGFIKEVASLIALYAGILGGIKFSDYCSAKISEFYDWHSSYIPLITFAGIFLGVLFLVYLISDMLSNLAKKILLGGVDKITGAAFGMLKYAVVMSVIFFFIESCLKSYPTLSFESKNQSLLYKHIQKIAPAIVPSISNF